MICKCGQRHAPRYYDEWECESLGEGKGIKIVPTDKQFEKEYDELFMSDIKCPCHRCSL